jgi:uncharacterized protein (TIGR01244 family)
MTRRFSTSIPLVLGIIATVALAGSPCVTKVQKEELAGIVNYSLIHESFGVAGSLVGFGGSTEPAAMQSLSEQDFTTIINLRLASEEGVDIEAARAAADEAGLNYIHLPMDTKSKDFSYVDEFMAIAGDKTNQPVYLHCGSATRAAALWMILRVLADDWDIARASEEARLIAKKPEQAVAFATAYLEARNE